MQLFLEPGAGAYDGVFTVDWISFGLQLTAVEEIPDLETVKIYPNPVIDQIGVSLDLLEASEVSMRLYDAMGSLVLQGNPTYLAAGNNFERIDIEHLTNGLYFLQLTVNGKDAKAVSIVKQ